MSDNAEGATPIPAAEVRVAPTMPDASFARRRRLLKLGASSVPVALTLTSRPVLAWHCNTTSAWGSAQMMPNNSTTVRNAANQLPDESWTISDWLYNTPGGVGSYPWVRLGTQYSTSGVTSASKNYTIASLFSDTGGVYPVGLNGTDKVWYKINTGSTFQKYMIVAKLNARLIPNVASCLKSDGGIDQLRYMLDGSYTPPNTTGGSTWGMAEIQNYLYNNWIVR